MWLFDVLMKRLSALFAADAAAQFEAQFAARQSERRAELLRRADAYEAEGYSALAEDVRGQALGLPAPSFEPPGALAAPPASSAPAFPPSRNESAPAPAASLSTAPPRRRTLARRPRGARR